MSLDPSGLISSQASQPPSSLHDESDRNFEFDSDEVVGDFSRPGFNSQHLHQDALVVLAWRNYLQSIRGGGVKDSIGMFLDHGAIRKSPHVTSEKQ